MLRKMATGVSRQEQQLSPDSMGPAKPAYRALLEAQANDSDSSGTLRRKKKLRKEARRYVRLHRDQLKEEDPFLYYFGRVDRDKLDEYRSLNQKNAKQKSISHPKRQQMINYPEKTPKKQVSI